VSDARRCLAALDAFRVESGDLVRWSRPGSDSAREEPVETTATALLAHLRAGGEEARPEVDAAARTLLVSRRGEAWKSSRDTAAACMALTELARSRGVEPVEALVRIRGGGAILGSARLASGDLVGGSAEFAVRLAPDRRGRSQIHLETSVGGLVSFLAEVVRPAASRPAGPFAIRRSAGGAGPRRLGELIAVGVVIEAEREQRCVVVDCPVPAGAEPVRRPPSDLGLPAPLEGSRVELLRDRVRFLLPRLPAGRTELGYALRAVRRGTYGKRRAEVSLVYSPDVRAVAPEEAPLSVE
jgi:hypothetical protein